MAKVIHIRDSGKDPDNEVYIGRPKKGQPWHWGNPFLPENHPDQNCVALYYRWFLVSDDKRAVWQRQNFPALRGKTLVCFCKPHDCHGDPLVELLSRAEDLHYRNGGSWDAMCQRLLEECARVETEHERFGREKLV